MEKPDVQQRCYQELQLVGYGFLSIPRIFENVKIDEIYGCVFPAVLMENGKVYLFSSNIYTTGRVTSRGSSLHPTMFILINIPVLKMMNI